MLMDETGKVGIGTTVPAKQLSIMYPSYIAKTDVQGLIRLVGQSNDEYSGDQFSAGTALEFYNKWSGGNEYSVGRIAGRAAQSYDGGLQFDVSQNTGPGQSNFTTAMVILDNGDVGIGDTSPSYKLDVNGTANATTLRLRGNGFTWSEVSGTGYVQPSSWIRVNTVGLYSGTNGAHIYPNQGSDYGAWRMNGSRNGWGGISFEVSGIYNTLMSNTTTMGMYNDTDNEWMLECTRNAGVRLYYNAAIRIETTSAGASITGKLTATSKSFLIDHPTKKGKKLQHGSLEGPENGVYVRGKCESKVIELPDYWTGLVDEDTITVQLTPIGGWQKLYVKKIEDNKVYVGKFGFGSPKFFYNVYGERKDIEKMEVEY